MLSPKVSTYTPWPSEVWVCWCTWLPTWTLVMITRPEVKMRPSRTVTEPGSEPESRTTREARPGCCWKMSSDITGQILSLSGPIGG